MQVTVLKAFTYTADGVQTQNLTPGQTLDIPDPPASDLAAQGLISGVGIGNVESTPPTGKIVLKLTIASGQSQSDLVSLRDYSLLAVHVPSGSQGSWLALIRGEGTVSGYSRADDDTKYTLPVTAGDWVEIDPDGYPAVDRIAVELCSAESGTPQTQSSARTITIIGVGRS